MYTLYMLPFGEIILRLETIRFSGHHIYISGYDEDRNRIDFTMDSISYPDDRPFGCGYCHILSYAIKGKVTSCNFYRSLR